MEFSQQVTHIFVEARDIALRAGMDLGSAQLLLAMFTEEASPNQARSFLEEFKLDEDRILDVMSDLHPEPGEAMRSILAKAQTTASLANAELINSMHVLLAICQVSSSLAYRALERTGVDIPHMRVRIFSYVTGILPRRFFQKTALDTHSFASREAADGISRSGNDRAPDKGAELSSYLFADPNEETSDSRDRRIPWGEEERAEAEAQRLVALIHEARRPKRPTAPSAVNPSTPHQGQAAEMGDVSLFQLSPEQFPCLAKLGRNLTAEAVEGRLDPILERDNELDQILDILYKRRSNNPCIIGEPGVGKTALAEGIAWRLAKLAQNGAEARALIQIDVGALVAGTELRGSFSERMAMLRAEVLRAGQRVILFIDEVHTLIGAGGSSGALDAANDLKSALARGEFPCIGATSLREYRRHIESDSALERRFQPIILDEPTPEAAVRILAGVLPRYEEHHRVSFSDPCLETAVRLSARYITDRRLPDKALNLLDLAGARAARAGQSEVTPDDLVTIIARLTGITRERLVVSESESLLALPSFLEQRIIGQETALARIAETIQRNSAGFRSRRPIGSFLLLGPTGVGKTETVRVLADFLFQDREACSRFDMSEYMESHTIARLIGAPPGYVGHEEGGLLTEAVLRRPYQIVLFDEFEKASPEVMQVLLQILEEGCLTDSRGRKVNFAQTVVALTSNLGAGELERRGGPLGFGAARSRGDHDPQIDSAVLDAACKKFSPELWNRIDEKLVYRPLGREAVRRIARLLVAESAARLEDETGIRYEITDEVIDHLVASGGYDPRYGARPMRRTVQRLVEGLLSKAILAGEIRRGAECRVQLEGDGLALEIKSPARLQGAS